jgi:hypothetical protein
MKARLRLLAMILLIAIAWVLSGCATDVIMVNPRTAETATCKASLRGFNPWSQQEACIGDLLATGWVRQEPR